MRNPRKLRAFELADQLVVEIYRVSRQFPREELYGLTSQIRRAAVSVPTNIVEGCARNTEKDFVHFLHISYGSLAEVGYLIELSNKLDFLDDEQAAEVYELQLEAYRVLFGLIKSLSP